MTTVKYITCRGCMKHLMVFGSRDRVTKRRCTSCGIVNVLRFSQALGWSVTKEEEIQHGHQPFSH